MHTHHAWVLFKKNLSSDFLVLEILGCYSEGARDIEGEGAAARRTREREKHCTGEREKHRTGLRSAAEGG